MRVRARLEDLPQLDRSGARVLLLVELLVTVRDLLKGCAGAAVGVRGAQGPPWG